MTTTYRTNRTRTTRSKRPPVVALVTLGCPRNLVDSEKVLARLAESGAVIAQDVADADVVIVNTCGFILQARKESAAVIRRMAALKDAGTISALAVIGCLPAANARRLAKRIPQVDFWGGVASPGQIDLLSRVLLGLAGPAEPSVEFLTNATPRLRVTLPHVSFVRIMEGCGNRCSYCSIPAIRGPLRSRAIEDILQESQQLAETGVRELVIVGQDTTNYGLDLYGRRRLADLVRALADLRLFPWLRLLYTHPAHITTELLEAYADGLLLPYVDMPVQHISARVLKHMGRFVGPGRIKELVDEFRTRVEDVVIRTSFIVGYPLETDADFRRLVSFIRDYRIARGGVFRYSREKGTRAYSLGDSVPAAVKAERRRRLADAIRQNVLHRNAALVGRKVPSIYDFRMGPARWLGRTYADAPDIDFEIAVDDATGFAGKIAEVTVTGFDGMTLQGAARGE